MKILHLDSGREMKGGQIQMRLLIDGLRAAGVESGVNSPLWNEAIESPDLIHCHDAKSHTWAKKPFVVSRRVGFPVKKGRLSQWKYRRAAAYLAVSEYTAGTLREAGIPDRKIFVVPDGVIPMPPADRSTGRVLLLSKNGRDVPGTIPVGNLKQDLRECDVFVYLSDLEGFGSAALLAQAAGVPVVASPAGGLPEAVRYGTVLRQGEDIQEAIERTRKIAVDIPAVMNEFGVSKMVERTIEVYRRVLG